MKQFNKLTLMLAALMLPLMAQALPFVPTTSPTSRPIHWYQLKTGSMYIYAALGWDMDIHASNTASKTDEYLWCFVGDSNSGYKLYNRSMKKYMTEVFFMGEGSAAEVNYYEAGSGNNFYIYSNTRNGRITQKMYLCYDSENELYGSAYKYNQYTVTEVLVEEISVTAEPVISLTVMEEECQIQATGDGDVHLYINNTQVSNPYKIARTDTDQSITVTATAQEPGKEMSTVTKTLTIPHLELPGPGPNNGITLTPYGYHIPNNELGNEDSEGYAKLFDQNKSTKWCVVNSTGEWQTIWVDFKSNQSIVPTGYILTTGNDTYTYYGRNPKSWRIYAKAGESDDWTMLVTVSDGKNAGLGTKNNTDYSFDISNQKAYQFFRFEVSAIEGKDGWNPNNYVFQLAEFQFNVAAITGDVNGDGVVDVDDLNIVINVIIKKSTQEQWPNADVDGNGVVDVDDLNRVINIMVGKYKG